MVGSIAPNLHEGSRSEYLAQYVFASFGTAVGVPNQEDHGIDLHCTLMERVGQRAWPKAYYSVQVKSTAEPWNFDGEESIQWLVHYPMPLFLCVVDKPAARIRVYHTCPRFYMWASPPLPTRVRLVPGLSGAGMCTNWEGGEQFSLSAPILDFSVSDTLDDKTHLELKTVLAFWIAVESRNLYRINSGTRLFTMPGGYVTNSTDIAGWASQGQRTIENFDGALIKLRESLSWVATQLWEQRRLPAAARCSLLWRHLFPNELDVLNVPLHEKLNAIAGTEQSYHYAGVDRLNDEIDKWLQQNEGVEPKLPAGGPIFPPKP